jgi:predicted RNA-binding Zn ribbon-like protein
LAVLEATRLDRSRVRRCGREGCVLLFLDTSKNNTRRWCDMAVCGNRVKAATHYHRHRTGGAVRPPV